MRRKYFLRTTSSIVKAIRIMPSFTLHLIIILFILTGITTPSIGQKNSTASFIILFKKSMATKDGYILNKYVVNIPEQQADSLENHKIKISGEVTIIEGIDKRSKDDIIVQGRVKATKYILKPIIEVLE